MIPRENIHFAAGLVAALFAIVWMLDSTPAEDAAAAQQAKQEVRRDLAAAKACPPGHAVLWIDPTTMTCNKEMP